MHELWVRNFSAINIGKLLFRVPCWFLLRYFRPNFRYGDLLGWGILPCCGHRMQFMFNRYIFIFEFVISLHELLSRVFRAGVWSSQLQCMFFWLLFIDDRRYFFFDLQQYPSGHLLRSWSIFVHELRSRQIPAKFRLRVVHKLSSWLFVFDPIRICDRLYAGAILWS